MKKVCLSLLLALALCLGLSAPAHALPSTFYDTVHTTQGGNIYFRTEDNALTVVGADMGVSEMVIPASINGLPVTKIGYQCFAGYQNLISATLPETVAFISGGAFAGCENLERVNIPGSVTEIGDYAFGGCTSLKEVSIPDSVERIGSAAFDGCAALEQVRISSSVTSLEAEVFAGCAALTGVNIPASVKEIGASAFRGCAGLKSLTIPGNVEEIGVTAFYGCTGLKDVTLLNGVKRVGMAAFENCTSLASATVPASVDEIGSHAFDVEVKTGEDQWGGGIWEQKPIPGLVLRVQAGSYAETWCRGNSLPFTSGTIHGFADLNPGAFYLDAVAWAVEQGVTTGTSSSAFSPDQDCTHGQIITFLWRAAGKPDCAAQPPFAMTGSEYYYGAVKWAAEKDMVGADFKPDAPCSRADAVRYIWQAEGRPFSAYDGRFSDIGAASPYAQAVAWAVKQGVTTGASADSFNPAGVCTRGQIVTFLFRYYGK